MIVRLGLLGLAAAGGFAALVSQVLWQQLLTFVSGVQATSAAVIVATFMGGLGLGGLAGGRLADRLSFRRRLHAVAAAELALASYTACSAWILYDLVYLRFGALPLSSFSMGVLSAAAMLWPTFFMGLAFPMLVRCVADTDREPARWLAHLLAANAAGAAAGALAAARVLLPVQGYEGALATVAGVNAGCALLAIVLAGAGRVGRPAVRTVTRDTHGPLPAGLSFPAWALAAAMAGFVAMAFEMVWFRLLGVVVKSDSTWFAQLLAIYLACTGVGALVGSRSASRRALRAFFLAQAAVPLTAACAVGLFIAAITSGHIPGALAAHLAAYDGAVSVHWLSARAFVVVWLVPLWIVAVPALLTGLAGACLHRGLQLEPGIVGHRAGWLYAAGVAGGAAGALTTGLVLLDLLGTAGTLRCLALSAFPFAFLGFRQAGRTRPAALTGAVAVALAGYVAVPSAGVLWRAVHAAPATSSYAEDRTGIALVQPSEHAGGVVLKTNGLGQSAMPYDGTHTALGALSALVHPRPEHIAIIGLGLGNTLYSAAARRETTRIDAIEIVQPVFDMIRRIARHGGAPGATRILADPRIRYHFADGRAFLMRADAEYDVIEADARRPQRRFANRLYSVEYFTLLRERLRPGGLAVTWVPTRRVLDGLRLAFPHVLVLGEVGIGSEAPVPFHATAIRRRMAEPFTRAHYDAANIDITEALEAYLRSAPLRFGPGSPPVDDADVNRDLFPRDEFAAVTEGS